ncbi:MAG: hypothetical protein GY816_13745 [Cytophagales bacterium]|nr:hypothetical protein [Cytophagales bacterium]
MTILRDQPDFYSEDANIISQNIIKRGLFGFLWGLSLDFYQLWIFLVCCKVTLTVVMTTCLPKQIIKKISVNVPKIVRWTKRKPQEVQIEMSQLNVTKPQEKHVHFSEAIEQITIDEDRPPEDSMIEQTVSPLARSSQQSSNLLPNRGSYYYKVGRSDSENPTEMISSEILMMRCECQSNVACSRPAMPFIRLGPSEFPLTIQGKELTALLDTGSTLTVLPLRTAKLLGMTDLTAPKLVSATSMTGHTISFLGSKIVNMKIGNERFTHEVHVAPDTNVKYQCIIGTDLLKHMPKFTIDYKNGIARFNHSTLPIGAPFEQRKVSLVHGVQIQPQAQVTLVAKLQDFQTEEEGKPFVLEPVTKFLENTGLALGRILAAPNHDGALPILAINPGFAPVLIYPQTTVATACNVAGIYAPSEKDIKADGQIGKNYEPKDRVHILSSIQLENIEDKVQPAEFYSPLQILEEKFEFPYSKCKRTPIDDQIMVIEPQSYEHLDEVTISDDNLNVLQQKQLKDLLHQYADRFSKHRFDLGQAKGCDHKINTGVAPPFKSRPYRIPISQRSEVDTEIEEMAKAGIVRQSMSPYSSPVILIRKPDGTNRFVVDYRKLNSQTLPDSFPLPRVDETLERLANVKYLTTLDLSAGYWQVPLCQNDNSIEKSAFVVHSGLWEFTTLAFGLTNGPSTFQRLMGNVIKGLLH